MLFDDNVKIRCQAFNQIIKIREEDNGKNRIFKTVNVNLKAKNYIDLVDFNQLNLTEPPLTKNLSIDDLKKIVNDKEVMFELPCHTQAVERTVKVF